MTYLLSIVLLLTPLSFAHAENPNFLNEKAYSESLRTENIKEITAQNIPAIKEMLFTQFSTEQDHQYFEKVMTGFKPYKIRISASEKNKTVSVFGDSFDITLSDINPAKKSLKINGETFQFAEGKSLETATAEVVAILSKRQTRSIPGWGPLFIGEQAHALVPLIAAAGGATVLTTTGVLPAALNEVRVFALTDSLEVLTSNCKKRRADVPYETSLAYNMLSKLSRGKPGFTLEEQRQITDCKQWADSGRLKDYLDSKKNLIKLCERGREALKCMDEYKAASDLKHKKAAPAAAAKSTGTAQ